MTEELNTDRLSLALEQVRYIPEDKLTVTLFLALKLKKPILIEGPPGTGKTELSKAVSRALKYDFFRIQCYEGITFEQIIGEWNYQKQLLQLEISRNKNIEENVFAEDFFIKRPLLNAFINKNPSVLLIDEIDKADEEVESFLLQALGEGQITVNDLGTFNLENNLLVVLTSNSQRVLLDETRDRCLYLYIDYPNFEREVQIVKAQVPEASADIVENVVKIVQKIRKLNLLKKPSIRATIDWVRTILAMGKSDADPETLENTVNVIIKNHEDRDKISKQLFE
jgi:MoxR-like ATPase